MPKIVRFHKLGGPEVLKIEDETSKQPGRGEVRLQVQAGRLEPGGIDVRPWPVPRTAEAACWYWI